MSVSLGDTVFYLATAKDASTLQVGQGKLFPAIVTSFSPLLGEAEVSLQVFFTTSMVAKLRVKKGQRLGEYHPRQVE